MERGVSKELPQGVGSIDYICPRCGEKAVRLVWERGRPRWAVCTGCEYIYSHIQRQWHEGRLEIFAADGQVVYEIADG